MLTGSAREDATPESLRQRKAAALMLADFRKESQPAAVRSSGVTPNICSRLSTATAPVRCTVWFRRHPNTLQGAEGRNNFYYQRLLGDGCPGFLHLAITHGPAEDIHQRPVATDGFQGRAAREADRAQTLLPNYTLRTCESRTRSVTSVMEGAPEIFVGLP